MNGRECENSLPCLSPRASRVLLLVMPRHEPAAPLAQPNAVNAPAGAIDVLDNNGVGPLILRNRGQVGRQHAVLIAFDVDFQDGDFGNGVLGEQGGETPDLHGATDTGPTEGSGALVAARRKQALAVVVADRDTGGGNLHLGRGVTVLAGETQVECERASSAASGSIAKTRAPSPAFSAA